MTLQAEKIARKISVLSQHPVCTVSFITGDLKHRPRIIKTGYVAR